MCGIIDSIKRRVDKPQNKHGGEANKQMWWICIGIEIVFNNKKGQWIPSVVGHRRKKPKARLSFGFSWKYYLFKSNKCRKQRRMHKHDFGYLSKIPFLRYVVVPTMWLYYCQPRNVFVYRVLYKSNAKRHATFNSCWRNKQRRRYKEKKKHFNKNNFW